MHSNARSRCPAPLLGRTGARRKGDVPSRGTHAATQTGRESRSRRRRSRLMHKSPRQPAAGAARSSRTAARTLGSARPRAPTTAGATQIDRSHRFESRNADAAAAGRQRRSPIFVGNLPPHLLPGSSSAGAARGIEVEATGKVMIPRHQERWSANCSRSAAPGARPRRMHARLRAGRLVGGNEFHRVVTSKPSSAERAVQLPAGRRARISPGRSPAAVRCVGKQMGSVPGSSTTARTVELQTAPTAQHAFQPPLEAAPRPLLQAPSGGTSPCCADGGPAPGSAGHGMKRAWLCSG
jgi:hypothetical protein